jgi:hypothetical protein
MVMEPMTRLVEIEDENNKPTGEFETRVRIQTKDQEGKPVTLDLDPLSAVKQLKEMPEKYGNLFISPAEGGLGLRNLGKGGAAQKPKHQMSTEEYMEARRKERTAATGARRRVSH